MNVSRRTFVCGVACAAAGGCGTDVPPGTTPPTGCSAPSPGPDVAYCLMSSSLVRVAGAARLSVDEAVLANVDDNNAVIVARDAGGLHALSAICTHACCIVSLCRDGPCADLTPSPGPCETTTVQAAPGDGEGIVCPCHGSAFRLSDGTPLSGPATTPLPSYALTIDADDVLVDTGTTVDPGTRV